MGTNEYANERERWYRLLRKENDLHKRNMIKRKIRRTLYRQYGRYIPPSAIERLSH